MNYLEGVIKNLQYLMIPRLIVNLEESTGLPVIWKDNNSNAEHFKDIEKKLFITLHPTSRIPYLLNYSASAQNMEINFEVSLGDSSRS
jgi:hypothetical protein